LTTHKVEGAAEIAEVAELCYPNLKSVQSLVRDYQADRLIQAQAATQLAICAQGLPELDEYADLFFAIQQTTISLSDSLSFSHASDRSLTLVSASDNSALQLAAKSKFASTKTGLIDKQVAVFAGFKTPQLLLKDQEKELKTTKGATHNDSTSSREMNQLTAALKENTRTAKLGLRGDLRDVIPHDRPNRQQTPRPTPVTQALATTAPSTTPFVLDKPIRKANRGGRGGKFGSKFRKDDAAGKRGS